MPQVRSSEHTPLLTALLEGPAGAGKTALAATLGLESQFPFVKVVSSDAMVGFSEPAKAAQIAKVFEDAYRVRAHIWVSRALLCCVWLRCSYVGTPCAEPCSLQYRLCLMTKLQAWLLTHALGVAVADVHCSAG